MTLPYAANRAESLSPPTNSSHDKAALSRIEVLAAAIERMGMSSVASILLRAFKPAAWTGSQLLWMMQPFFSSRRNDPTAGVAGLALFLEKEANIDSFIERLNVGHQQRTEGGR